MTSRSKDTLTGSVDPPGNNPPPVFTGPDPNNNPDLRQMASKAASYAITSVGNEDTNTNFIEVTL